MNYYKLYFKNPFHVKAKTQNENFKNSIWYHGHYSMAFYIIIIDFLFL